MAGYGDGLYGVIPYGAGSLTVGGIAAILNSQDIGRNMKSQFIAGEDLRIVIPPFLDTSTSDFITSGDIATLTVVKPDGTLYAPSPTLIRNANSNFWEASIDVADFEAGEWSIVAVSDDANALDQYRNLVWGDYMSDIRQATLGRWRIVGTQLLLYQDDGTTVFRTFDLKDVSGSPSVTQIFERDPVP